MVSPVRTNTPFDPEEAMREILDRPEFRDMPDLLPEPPDRKPPPVGPDAVAGQPANEGDPLKRQATDLIRELTIAFRERQQFGSGGGARSPSGVAVERIKLLATFFNTVAAGLLTAGLIGPMAAYLYGLSSPTHSYLEITEGAVIIFLLSILSHLAGRNVLGRLAQ